MRPRLPPLLALALALVALVCAHGAAHAGEASAERAESEGAGPAPRHEGHHPGHGFEDAEQWAERLEDPARDEWQRPEVVLEALALEPDAVVADIGSATGYFPVRIAPRVPEGRVWGVDVEPAMVRYLNARARRAGLGNLFSVLGTPDDPLLPEPVDRVLMVDTYHHVEDRAAYFETLAGSVAADGRLVVVDFAEGQTPVGPPAAMRIPPEQVRRELESAGWTLERALRDSLPYQYILVFRPPPAS